MPKPSHRRCRTCNGVTARYLRTDRKGPFVFKVWVRDADRGEVSLRNGTEIYCREHAPR
jgi:hypothetical protein